MNILLVDDEPKNLTVLESILDSPDYRLTRAQSGHEALLALLAGDFALLVLDIHMPGMSGLELAQLVKERKKTQHIPIIFLTAHYAEDEHVLQGYTAGAVDYLTKPVNPAILRSKVAVFVDLCRKAALEEANRALQKEIIEHQQAEEALREKTVALESAAEQIKASLSEKEVLLKEIHHRVKNNMQVICSLLNLQSGYIREPEALSLFREGECRIRSMAMIHEKLYQSESLARVDFADYLSSLSSLLFTTYVANPAAIRLATHLDPVFLDVDTALPLGLIVNELVSNSLKYAYPEGDSGVVELALRAGPGTRYKLSVRDEGVGLPPGFDLNNTSTLGLHLVTILSAQLHADLSVESNGRGTAFEVTFESQPTARERHPNIKNGNSS